MAFNVNLKKVVASNNFGKKDLDIKPLSKDVKNAKRHTFIVDKGLVNRLKEVAYRDRKTITGVLTEAIVRYLNENE